MRIGIDIDDTITNTYTFILKRYSEYFNVEYSTLIKERVTYDILQKNPLYRQFVKDTFEKTMMDVDLKDNVKETIDALTKDGHEIIFITARHHSEYENPYEFSNKYLKKNNIHFDELHVSISNKGEFAREHNVDVLIDDSVRHCLNAKDNKVIPILFDNVFNKQCRRFKRAKSWNDVYEFINKIDSNML